jgi:hypothetical protein
LAQGNDTRNQGLIQQREELELEEKRIELELKKELLREKRIANDRAERELRDI